MFVIDSFFLILMKAVFVDNQFKNLPYSSTWANNGPYIQKKKTKQRVSMRYLNYNTLTEKAIEMKVIRIGKKYCPTHIDT